MRKGYREPCDVATNVGRQRDDSPVGQRESFRSVIRSTAAVFAMTLALGRTGRQGALKCCRCGTWMRFQPGISWLPPTGRSGRLLPTSLLPRSSLLRTQLRLGSAYQARDLLRGGVRVLSGYHLARFLRRLAVVK